MNIIEAIKSGLRFRRIGKPYWASYRSMSSSCIHGNCEIHTYTIYPTCEDILAEDWEIEPQPEEKKELSWTQIKRAIDNSFDKLDADERIKKELGFKE